MRASRAFLLIKKVLTGLLRVKRDLVSQLILVSEFGLILLLILQHTIQCCLGDPSVLVGEGRQRRTLTFLCPICAVRRISMCLESLMVIEVQQLLSFLLELYQDFCKVLVP
ncbi:hypothetical protein CsSME_00045556 [Camellia sinensis var. sinensis]